MAQDGQLVRLAGGTIPDEQALADLLDPIALEHRLREARARRTEALARRDAGVSAAVAERTAAAERLVTGRAEAEAPPPEWVVPDRGPDRAPDRPLDRAPRPAPTAPLAGVPAAGNRQASVRLRVLPLLMFVAGVGLGATLVALAAMPSLRLRLAMLIAPDSVLIAEPAPPQVASTPPAPPALPPDPLPAPAAAAPTMAPDHAPDPVPQAAPSPAPAEAPAPVVAALEPDAAPPAAAPPAAEAAPPAVTQPGVPQPAEPPAAGPLPSRVVLHFPLSAEAEAMAARDRLIAAGVTDVQAVPVRLSIGRTNIRFYHETDAAAARALAEAITPEGGEVADTRDFTDYPSPAAPGKVEVWFSGTPAPFRPAAHQATPAPAAPAGTPLAPTDPTPPVAASSGETALEPLQLVPPETQAEAVARILVQRTYQRLRAQGGN